MTKSSVDLSNYSAKNFDRGKPIWVEILWRFVSALFFQNPLFPCYGIKRMLLLCVGARVGVGVLIKPRVTITFPWKVSIENHSWIGEGAWLDSLGSISIGSNVCISQNAYLCTGSHDSRRTTFDLI